MRRRRFLITAGVVGAAVVAPPAVGAGWWYARARTSNVGTLEFTNPLRIPPVLPPEPHEDGGVRFRLTAAPGEADLLPDRSTPAWGYNGSYLGPTLRVRTGERVTVEVRNDLPEDSSTHWHGMRLPAIMDGGPHQPIRRGEVWTPHWTIIQPASTLWYHPHLHRSTARHVYQGLAGLFLIDDDLPLPDEYGVDDIPLVVQDKKFHPDGSLDLSDMEFRGLNLTGLLGDTILINGTYDPYLDVSRTPTRFRLLNASNARIYRIGFTDDREFHVVATDSGLLPAPRPVRRVQLSPAERVEIMVRFDPGERVVLRSYPQDLGTNPLYGRLAGGDDTFDLLQLRAAATLESSPPLPAELPAPEPVRTEPDSWVREFVMGDFTINDETMDHHHIGEIVPAGTVEIWEVTNAGGFPSNGLPHNFHVHGCDFEVLERDGKPPPERLQGHKDTVFLPPETTTRLAIRFDEYSDPEFPYMYHCHIMAHEDAGMMGQFVVVDTQDQG